MTAKPLAKVTKATPKASRSLANKGDTNILWYIVGVIGVVIGVVIVFIVAHGIIPSISAGNALTVSAQELGGVLTVDIKAMGTSPIKITAINLLPSGTCTWTAYYNGQSQSSFSLPFTLNPGDTLSLICNPAPSGVTQIQVITSSGTYSAPVS